MSMRLCWWPATDGGRVELYRDGALFWTRHIYSDGSSSVVLVDTRCAMDHYVYAQRTGHVDGPWPFPSRRTRMGQEADDVAANAWSGGESR